MRTTFLVMNSSDLNASCIHKRCTFTCFALPNPLQLTMHIVADASKCRLSWHTIPRSSCQALNPQSFRCGLDSRKKFTLGSGQLHHLLLLGPHLHAVSPLMITPADTDRRVVLSPRQSASEHASNSLLLPAEQAYCSWLPNEVSPNPLYSLHVKDRTCHRTASELEIGSVCATSAVYFVMSPPGVVTCHLRSVPVATVTHAVPCPCPHRFSPRLSPVLALPSFFLSTAHGVAE